MDKLTLNNQVTIPLCFIRYSLSEPVDISKYNFFRLNKQS